MEQPTTVRKPEGGFVFISVRQVCRVWVAYQHGLICLADLWVWFAAQELVARRCQVPRGQPIHYRAEELTRLVGGTHSMPVSVRRLTQAGVLHWEETKLTFPDDRTKRSDLEALTTMLEQITNHDRRIPVPRRVLRYLAGGCPKVMIATILGHLLRCLYYRQGACAPRGHCKATWIAHVFGVSVRQVKQARHRLEELDLLQRSATVQWVLNRYGQTMTFNLQWHGPRDEAHPHAAHATEERCAVVSARVSEASAARDSAPDSLPESPCSSSHLSTPAPVFDPRESVKTAHLSPSESTAITPDAPPALSVSGEHRDPAGSERPGILITLFLEARAALRAGKLAQGDMQPVVLPSVAAPSSPMSRVSPTRPTPGPVPPESADHSARAVRAAVTALGSEANTERGQDPEALTESPFRTRTMATSDLASDPKVPGQIAPPTPSERAPIAPPNSHLELSMRAKNQKPACGSPPGVLTTLFLEARAALREGRVAKTETRPVVVRTVSPLNQAEPCVPSVPLTSEPLTHETESSPAQTPLPAPSLRCILLHDLRDTTRLLQLYAQAVRAQLIGASEAERLAFVALAQHVLAYRPTNPGGLFTQLLRTRHFDYATQDDEDSAVRRLKRHLYKGNAPVSPVVETVLRRVG